MAGTVPAGMGHGMIGGLQAVVDENVVIEEHPIGGPRT